MNKEKIKGYLNIARKAGYLIIGGEKLEGYTKKLYLILCDTACVLSTVKIANKLKEKGLAVLSIEGLGELLSIPNCKIIGLKNKNISEIIENLLND